MRSSNCNGHALGLGLVLLATLACSGAGNDAIFGTSEEAGPMLMGFAQNGEIPVQEGLTLGADPEQIHLDPCDPEAPTDPETGKLLGKATIGAVVLDADLQPVVGAKVVFSATAGLLESMGQPAQTDERGLATDTLAVDEDDAGDVIITATSNELSDTLTVPVIVEPKRPVTLEMEPAELWPPNHQMREVSAVFDGLECYPSATFELLSVTSSEEDNGNGDGNTTDDIQGAEIGTADTELLLRAERTGGGDGRIYTVVFGVADGEGSTSTLTATVTVPHDQGN